jgi:protein CpxP
MKKQIIIALVVVMSCGGVVAANAVAPPDSGAPAAAAAPRDAGHPQVTSEDRPCDCREQGGEHHGGHRHPFAKLAKKLGLSEGQKKQIKEIFAKSRSQTKPLMDKLVTEKRALRTLIQSGTANESAIRSQAAKVAGVEADLAVQRAQTSKQVRALLTADQIAKFDAIQKERDRHFDEFRGRMDKRFNRSDPEE